jgi:hypothetical protein
MNFPSHYEFLHAIEVNVRAELAEAQASRPDGTEPMDQWVFDPADAEREEVELRSLLGAIVAVEHMAAPETMEIGDHSANPRR